MSSLFQQTARSLKDLFFEAIHGRNLIYNVCWEDPRLDREALQFDRTTRIAMITSAGCNALEYLLDDPAEIHCIDMNPRQNALLELKIRMIEHASHSDFFQFFGLGAHPDAVTLYKSVLRPTLTPTSRFFWDRKIEYFLPKRSGRTFLYRGTSGSLAWLAHLYFRRHKRLKSRIDALFASTTPEGQAAAYDLIEPDLWNRFIRWVMDQQLVMTLMGVPEAQKKLIDEKYPGGMASYLKDGFRQTFTAIPVRDNYFWYGYIYGHYTPDCCPEYLKPEHFDTLKARVSRLHLHTTSYADFLKREQGKLTHFILLDHQDWMARHAKEALVMEWTHILDKAAPGARVMMRSASPEIDYLPFFVHDRLKTDKAYSAALNRRCRVGTYASTLTGTLS